MGKRPENYSLYASNTRVAPIIKNHRLIKRAAYLMCILATIPQSHSSLDSSIAKVSTAQECIVSTSLIVKAINSPLHKQLANNFDCIHEHLEKAKQEIMTWHYELC
ncbi:MAG: hypothetical protein LBJ89_04360 [Holosporales bacterium]|nr:hypothetical protein [Holosporales bacterium]